MTNEETLKKTPKFKVGDKITNKGLSVVIDDIKNGQYWVSDILDTFDCGHIDISDQDEWVLAEVQVSEALEEELKRYVNSDEYVNSIGISGLMLIARHFADWQKQQLMKDAVDGVTKVDNNGNILLEANLNHLAKNYDFSQRVKLIIIKEE